MVAVQSFQPFLQEATTPESNRGLTASQLVSHDPIGVALGEQEDDTSALHIRRRQASRAGADRQLRGLLIGQHEGLGRGEHASHAAPEMGVTIH
jgi:hypothetical protein